MRSVKANPGTADIVDEEETTADEESNRREEMPKALSAPYPCRAEFVVNVQELLSRALAAKPRGA
jgi:hypothetical protein